MQPEILEKFMQAAINAELALHKAKQIEGSVNMARLDIKVNRQMLALDFPAFRADYCQPDWLEDKAQHAWTIFRESRADQIKAMRGTIAANVRVLEDIISCLALLMSMQPELEADAPRAYRVVNEKTMEHYAELQAIMHRLAPPFEA